MADFLAAFFVVATSIAEVLFFLCIFVYFSYLLASEIHSSIRDAKKLKEDNENEELKYRHRNF